MRIVARDGQHSGLETKARSNDVLRGQVEDVGHLLKGVDDLVVGEDHDHVRWQRRRGGNGPQGQHDRRQDREHCRQR